MGMRFGAVNRGTFGALALGVLLSAVGVAVAVVPAGAARAPTRRAPDLLVSTLTMSSGRLTVGGIVTASVRTANVGSARAKPSSTGLYLSNDARKSRDDIRLGSVRIPTLKPHKSKLATIYGTVPLGTLPAGYRLLACADDTGKVRERNERNNCQAATSTVAVLAKGTGGGGVGGTGGGSTGGTGGGPPPDDDHDGYPNSVDCAPEDPAVHPGAPDPPDQAFRDSNCDGIDGEASHAIFVSGVGSDSNPGTESQPKQTLAAGVAAAAAQGKDVYTTLGDY